MGNSGQQMNQSKALKPIGISRTKTPKYKTMEQVFFFNLNLFILIVG